jgi:branched-chain amino acid transport system substrate-binding protein
MLPDPPRPQAIQPAAAAARLSPAPGERWHVSLLAALTGPGSLPGDAFRNGVEMAVQGINGAGGLLGRLVEISTFNTASSPQGARATLSRALERAPLALLGPVAPSETRAVAPLVRERRILQIAVADEGEPPPGDGLLLLTSPDPAERMAMLAGWLAGEARVERLALLATARDGRPAAALAAAWRARRAAVVADLTLAHTPHPGGPHPGEPHPGGRDEAAGLPAMLAQIADARPQALFIGAGGRLAARIIRAARDRMPGLLLLGTAGLLAPGVLAASGAAAIGLRGFAGLAPDAPVDALEDFRTAYLGQYRAEPDALVMQGHIALSLLQAAILRIAPRPPTGPALAAAVRAAPLRAAVTPGILLDTSWDARGRPHRVGFVAEVLPGGGLGWSVVPPLSG